MRIVIVGENLSDYLAKCHEAFRTGIRRVYNAVPFGSGYPDFDRTLATYGQIIDRVSPDAPPDLLFSNMKSCNPIVMPFRDLEQIGIPKTLYISDYWEFTETNKAGFLRDMERFGITFVTSYFPQLREIFADTSLAGRIITVPASIDPEIFNDWGIPKTYDVGFLAAGTMDYMSNYPERHRIHKKLLKRRDFSYLWAKHPGWNRGNDLPLVGRNFSKAINSCRIVITTGGKYRNAHAKYVEILASRSLLLADEPVGAEILHLVDGYNYVRIDENDVEDKIEYYLKHPDLCHDIARAGYVTAMRFHNCYARAVDFYDATRDILSKSGFAETRVHFPGMSAANPESSGFRLPDFIGRYFRKGI